MYDLPENESILNNIIASQQTQQRSQRTQQMPENDNHDDDELALENQQHPEIAEVRESGAPNLTTRNNRVCE